MLLHIGTGEPAFWPLHVAITAITFVIFCLIMLVISRITGVDAHLPIGVQNLTSSDTLSLVSLFVAFVGVLVTNFLQVPVLDYTVYPPSAVNGTTTKFTTGISDYGFVSAKNVILSMEGNNLAFRYSISEPFLADHFHYKILNPIENNTVGKENIQIDVIPIRSVTNVTTFIDTSNATNSDYLKINVRSDESIGNRGTPSLIIYYVILALFYSILATLFTFGKISRTVELTVQVIILSLVVVVVAAVVESTMYYT